MAVSLVSPGDLLAAQAKTPAVIIDARPAEEYATGHIPGAISLEWSDWCRAAPATADPHLHRAGYWGALRERPAEWFGDQLASRGVSSARPIVVYADGPRSKGRDGRIAWMLLYLGARSVSLLDGGWPAWVQAGGDVQVETPRPPKGQFTMQMQAQRRCTSSDLIALQNSDAAPLLIDTRSPPEFEGWIYTYQPRMGHLPGAVLVPFNSLYLPSGRFLDSRSYTTHVVPLVGRSPSLVAYCEVGVRACAFALLHEMYTGQTVRVYDGSIMEWSLDPTLPVQGRA